MEINVIDKFEEEYFFLSNYFECPVYYMGHKFRSSEAAYQAQKCPSRTEEFLEISADEAKKLGKTVELRADWDDVKDNIMYFIVRNKFIPNDDLMEKLIATGNAELIEGNWWKDTYWGVCDGIGENKLGKILMQIRKECMDLYIPKE